ncbi:4'-phosphopantetheinyl transferase family protein [Streptomyces hypolithicus]
MAEAGAVAEQAVTERPVAAGLTRLWLLPAHAVTSFAADLGGYRLLTEDERARGARLVTPAARRRFLARRLLCRYALSEGTGRPLDHWRFTAGRYGRPEPGPDADGVRFSLSDTEGLTVCAVSQGRVCGVDVEQTAASAASAHYISRFFASDELLELAALEPAALVGRVGELWVLKEAYLKALGTGLHRSLAGFSFAAGGRTADGRQGAGGQPGGAGRISVYDAEQPAWSGHWSFELLRPGPQHVLALAVEGTRSGAVQQTWLG